MELTRMEEEGIKIMTENIQKKNFIRKITSVTEGRNTIYSKKVELSTWIGLIRLRVFGNHRILKSLQKKSRIVSLSLNS